MSKDITTTIAGVHDHVVCTEFNNGEGVLVDLNTKRYYQLNETATMVWQAIERGHAVDQIASELESVYDISRDHASASVSRIISEFRTQKLLR
jgi:Coenzyme PQQ synthesis protein D (PqqD)